MFCEKESDKQCDMETQIFDEKWRVLNAVLSKHYFEISKFKSHQNVKPRLISCKFWALTMCIFIACLCSVFTYLIPSWIHSLHSLHIGDNFAYVPLRLSEWHIIKVPLHLCYSSMQSGRKKFSRKKQNSLFTISYFLLALAMGFSWNAVAAIIKHMHLWIMNHCLNWLIGYILHAISSPWDGQYRKLFVSFSYKFLENILSVLSFFFKSYRFFRHCYQFFTFSLPSEYTMLQ